MKPIALAFLVPIVIFFAIAPCLAETFEYCGSTLWTGLDNICTDGIYAYCAYDYGFAVLDISVVGDPVMISKIALGNIRRIKLYNSFALALGYGMDMTIIDISNPNHPQVAAVCETGGSAADACIRDSLVYVAGYNYGLFVVNIANPHQPVTIGAFPNIGANLTLDMAGDCAFLCSRWNEIDVINISNPAEPYEVSIFPIDSDPRSIVIADTIAYVAEYGAGLVSINISDPSSLRKIGSYDPIAVINDIAIRGNYAFTSWEWNCMASIDISNPSNMRLVGNFESEDQIDNIVIDGNTAYLSERASLEIVNIANPLSMNRIGAFNNTENIFKIKQYGEFIVAGDGSRLWVVDKSNPQDPHPISVVNLPYGGELMAFYRHYALLRAGTSYLTSVDLSDPYNPSVSGNVVLPFEYICMAVWDHYAYLGTGNGVRILEISDPSNPIESGEFESAMILELLAVDSLLVGGGTDLYIWGLNDPSLPTLISQFDLEDRYIQGIDVYGDFIHLALLEEQVNHPGVYYSVNIENVSQPYFGGMYSTYEWMDNVVVDGNLAFISNNSAGLTTVNISDPFNPVMLEAFTTPGYVRDVIIEDSLAYIADGSALSVLRYNPPCFYTTGDLNGSGSFDGQDVVFGVNYFKGGATPPYSCLCDGHDKIFVAGDVNQSCSFNGLDMTYMVRYLKGGPQLESCEDCPTLTMPSR